MSRLARSRSVNLLRRMRVLHSVLLPAVNFPTGCFRSSTGSYYFNTMKSPSHGADNTDLHLPVQ